MDSKAPTVKVAQGGGSKKEEQNPFTAIMNSDINVNDSEEAACEDATAVEVAGISAASSSQHVEDVQEEIIMAAKEKETDTELEMPTVHDGSIDINDGHSSPHQSATIAHRDEQLCNDNSGDDDNNNNDNNNNIDKLRESINISQHAAVMSLSSSDDSSDMEDRKLSATVCADHDVKNQSKDPDHHVNNSAEEQKDEEVKEEATVAASSRSSDQNPQSTSVFQTSAAVLAPSVSSACSSSTKVPTNGNLASTPGAFAVAGSPNARASSRTTVKQPDPVTQQLLRAIDQQVQQSLCQHNDKVASFRESETSTTTPTTTATSRPAECSSGESDAEDTNGNDQASIIREQDSHGEEASSMLRSVTTEMEAGESDNSFGGGGEGGGEAGLVRAELVTPVHAVEVTAEPDTDLEAQNEPHGSTYNRNAPVRQQSRDSGDSGSQLSTDKAASRERRHRLVVSTLILAVLCLIAIAVAVPLVIKANSGGSDDDRLPPRDADADNGVVTPFGYDCFTSTKALDRAQKENQEQNLFVICPNTYIQVGVVDYAKDNFTRFIEGDSPLVIIRENVEVRCGLDGSVNNNCIFEGGTMHVLMHQNMSENESGLQSRPTHNVTIRGLTFTGHIRWGGQSLIVSNPGKKVRFVDCLWENLTVPTGLILGGTNFYQVLKGHFVAKQSLEIVIVNSTFRNIEYGNGPLIVVNDQSIRIQGSQFEDIRLSPKYGACSVGFEGCEGLIYCFGESICDLRDICVQSLEYFGSASLLTVSNRTEWSAIGTSSLTDVELSKGEFALSGNACTSGVAQFDQRQDKRLPNGFYGDDQYTAECLDNGNNIMWEKSLTCGSR